MREFLRLSGRIVRAARHAPTYVRDGVKAVRVFDAPGRFLTLYAAGRPRKGHVIRLRDGYEIETSESDSDFATMMVVLVREEYAPIPRDGIIVDIGANIGAFMLYAIRSGARRVISFEPSRDAYAVLCRNVERNRLADRVLVRQLAVSNRSSSTVWFPTASSPMNRMRQTPDQGPVEHIQVSTTTVTEIVEAHGDIDLLKIDCEGAEYDIVSSTPGAVWSRIRSVRIEFHDGRTRELVEPLQAAGLRLTRLSRDPIWPDAMGMLNFERG